MAKYEKTNGEAMSDNPRQVDKESILKIILRYYEDSRDSRKRIRRMRLSAANNSAFNGEFDFTAKVEGQSTETLPKVTTAVESFSAYIRRGLAQFGEWFRVDMAEDSVLQQEDVVSIIKEFLKEMPDGVGGFKSIEQVISDGAKAGALESLVVLKVHGRMLKVSVPPDIKAKIKDKWRLSIDLVPIEDYYPDPTGRKLYEIHRKKVDLFVVRKHMEAGSYDKGSIDALSGGGEGSEDQKEELGRDESDGNTRTSRETVSLMECYGTLVDAGGEVVNEDAQTTIANEMHVLSGPKPMKAWCGSPLVSGPLTRVPHTVWHRATMDYVSDLNQSLNELYNLVFDAGISAVHGVKEIRLNWLEDPASVAGGISPQQTIALNDSAPAGASAISVAKTGGIPGEVLALIELVQAEILEAAMTNEIRVGGAQEKQVLATEIIQSEQATAVLLDAVLGEYEQVLSAALTKAWQLIVQNLPNCDVSTMIRAVGEEKAVALAKMDPEERYTRYVKDSKILVTGISTIHSRSQELRKLIAVLQLVKSDPLLFQEYGKRIDGAKLFAHIFSSSGIDMADFSRTDEEIEEIGAQMQGQPGLPAEGGPGAEALPAPQNLKPDQLAAQLQ